MRDGVVAQHNQFVASARQHQEQRQHERDEDQPRRYLDVDCDAAGECAQHEANRNRDHVDDHLMLGPQRIPKLKRDVQQCDSHECRAQYDAQHGRNRCQRDGRSACCANRDIAARQRAVAFFGIQPIRLAVGDVIENVTGARKCAERDDCDDRKHDIVKNEQTLAEYQRRQYQRVFDPLMGPRQADHRGQLPGALAVVQPRCCVHCISLYRYALCRRKTVRRRRRQPNRHSQVNCT